MPLRVYAGEGWHAWQWVMQAGGPEKTTTNGKDVTVRKSCGEAAPGFMLERDGLAMKTTVWVVLVLAVMAGVLGGFWYGMVHAKGTMPYAPAAGSPETPGVVAEAQHAQATPEELTMLASVACGQALAGKEAPRCGVCPAGSEDGGAQGAPSSGPAGGWALDSVVFGHFTAAGVEEALLRSSGCESDAETFGGDFLLRRDGAGRWQRVRYIQGGEASGACLPLRWSGFTPAGANAATTGAAAGRDALVCDVGSLHQGVMFDSVWLITVGESAQQPGTGENTEFVTVSDYSADCPADGERHMEQVGGIDKVNLLPAGPDGRQDVEILASVGRAKLPAGLKPGDDCPDVAKKQYRLVFHNAGDHFVPGDGFAAMQALAKSGEEGDVTVSGLVTPFAY